MQIGLVLGNGLLLLFVILEIIVIVFSKKDEVPWREIVFNLNSGHILLWIFRGLEVAAFHLTLQYFSFDLLANWSYLSKWIFCFFAWDFCFYWMHRMHHKISLFWGVHVVHHEGEHFNLSLGIRNSWYSSLTSFPFFAILAFIGIPLEIFIATSSIHYFIQFYNHNSLVKKSGFLEYILITPSHHRVHHGKNDPYIDKNFGGTFVIWDKLFGSFQNEKTDVKVQFGTKDHVKSQNPFWANNIPFLKLFKFKVPAFFKSVNGNYKIGNIFIVSACLLLFLMLLYFVYQEKVWTGNIKLSFFILIFFGTIANGGLSENKKWGMFFWMLISLILIPAFIFKFQINDLIILSIFALIIFHGICLTFKYFLART